MVVHDCGNAVSTIQTGCKLVKTEQPEPIEGFIVHSSFSRSARTPTLYLTGRLKNGETFAVVEERQRPCFYVRESDISRVLEYVKNNSEDVGARFAAEALKIHYGAAEKRSIRGSATADEEKTLKDEGVDFVKVPFPVSDDDKMN